MLRFHTLYPFYNDGKILRRASFIVILFLYHLFQPLLQAPMNNRIKQNYDDNKKTNLSWNTMQQMYIMHSINFHIENVNLNSQAHKIVMKVG